MTRRALRAVGFAALTLLLGSSSARVEPAPAKGLEGLLASSLREGRIDEAHADLFRLYAIVAADRLPAEYRTDFAPAASSLRSRSEAVAEPLITRCGTAVLRAVRARLVSMPADVRAEADSLLNPPRPRLALTASAVGKSVVHALPNWFVTQNFSIEWGANLTNEDGTTPVRDANGNGVPDVVETWASYLEAVYAQDAKVFNASNPAAVYQGTPLETQLVPVYMGNSDSTELTQISSGTYAFTQDSAPAPYLVVNNDLTFVPPNDAGSSGLSKIQGAMKVTAAHEFFHVIQFSLPLPANWVDMEDDWWLEASAVWMEDEVFDDVNDYYQYFNQAGGGGWANFVEAGLPVRMGDVHFITRGYGSVIFPRYLSEHVGGRASMNGVWDLIRAGRRILFDSPGDASVANGALNVYAEQLGFPSGIGQLFLGFAAANADNTPDPNNPNNPLGLKMDYREGAKYGSVPVRQDFLPAAAPPLVLPSYLGATYLLDAAGTGAGVAVNLTGTAAGTGPNTWGLAFSLRRDGSHALALGNLGPGGTSLGITRFGTADFLYAIPAFLEPGQPSSTYAAAMSSGAPAATPPGLVTRLSASPALGGLNLSWGTPAGTVAGYVVRWREPAHPFDSRALFGPVTSVELRGLAPTGYDVDVFAYDAAGNEGPAASLAAGNATTPLAAEVTATPAVAGELHTGSALPTPSTSGGGGGGGCFLSALHL